LIRRKEGSFQIIRRQLERKPSFIGLIKLARNLAFPAFSPDLIYDVVVVVPGKLLALLGLWSSASPNIWDQNRFSNPKLEMAEIRVNYCGK